VAGHRREALDVLDAALAPHRTLPPDNLPWLLLARPGRGEPGHARADRDRAGALPGMGDGNGVAPTGRSLRQDGDGCGTVLDVLASASS
jgi:hypothetical protein